MKIFLSLIGAIALFGFTGCSCDKQECNNSQPAPYDGKDMHTRHHHQMDQ